MSEKDKEIIEALAALLHKLKKLFHISSLFHHEEEPPDEKNAAAHADIVEIKKEATTITLTKKDDATGQCAIKHILKKENLTHFNN